MRRQLNTLYVTTEGAWLHKEGANLVMKVDGEERARLPAHMLEGVVCLGRVSISAPLLGYCADQGITVSYLTTNGRFMARVEGPVSGNVLLRREQYRRTDCPERCVEVVRNFLVGKIYNQRAVIGRAKRDLAQKIPAADIASLDKAFHRLKRIGEQLLAEPSVDVLRGMEGDAAQVYFGVFDHLIVVGDSAFAFSGRNRRPPLDRMNALLSFLYTLLTHDCRSALETVGLDPAVGFLHRDRPGRPSLALDIAEELRPMLGDRLAISLINRRQLSEGDFRVFDNGAVLLKDDARKRVLTAYQERKREVLHHAFLGENLAIGLLPYVQSQLLARHLRGDLDAYPPLLWR